MRIGHWDAVWYFPSVNGGFEGNINNLFTDYDLGPPATYNLKVHTLLHGFGSFEGSTLQLSYDGPAGGDWTGYLLKP